MLRERLAEWNAERVRQGVRQTLVDVARARFGESVASAVGAQIAETTGERALARVLQLVSTCKTKEELLLQIEAV